jgi:hypothetical protein
MTERAAHVVDHVLPADVPVRQWVFSVPHRLRHGSRTTTGSAGTVLQVFVRALRSAYRRQGLAGGETGTVTSIQRFGGAVNSHLHFHTIVLDGVFRARAGRHCSVPREARHRARPEIGSCDRASVSC